MCYALQQSREEKSAALLLRIGIIGHSKYEAINSLSQTQVSVYNKTKSY